MPRGPGLMLSRLIPVACRLQQNCRDTLLVYLDRICHMFPHHTVKNCRHRSLHTAHTRPLEAADTRLDYSFCKRIIQMSPLYQTFTQAERQQESPYVSIPHVKAICKHEFVRVQTLFKNTSYVMYVCDLIICLFLFIAVKTALSNTCTYTCNPISSFAFLQQFAGPILPFFSSIEFINYVFFFSTCQFVRKPWTATWRKNYKSRSYDIKVEATTYMS